MPNDPKWRTIARASGQRIGDVMAVYCHVIVTASQNVTRGHVHVVTEDLASALDMQESDVQAILDAMQGRVLDGEKVAGWEQRQPKKEDAGDEKSGAKSAAERKRAQREREREMELSQHESREVTNGHDESRNVTLDKDTDKDTDKNKEQIHTAQSDDCTPVPEQPAKAPKEPRPEYLSAKDLIAAGLSESSAVELHALRKRKRAPLTPRAWEGMNREFVKAGMTAEQGVVYLLEKGWQSFEASWVKTGPARSSPHILPDNSVHTADAKRYASTMPQWTDAERKEAMRGII
jgi:hypothetical protein